MRETNPPLTGSNSLRGLRVCICTPDYMHLVRNGGIGTSFQHTVSILAPMGADITVLYANLTPGMNSADRAEAANLVRKDGAKLEYLFPETGNDLLASIFPSDIFTATAYAAYQWLKTRSYDLVIFADWRGIAYYAVHAKRQGLAFSNTQLWIQAHSTALWHELNNQHVNFDETSIRVYHYERKSIELCDRVLGATQYLVDWMAEHGFLLPQKTSVFPLLINTHLLAQATRQITNKSDVKNKIEEIVFFGRLEKRKGLLVFLQALQRLVKYNSETLKTNNIKVTFLGKLAKVDGVSSITFIERELAGLDIDFTVNPSLSSSEAISYLQSGKALAVMPSLTDNSPLTVHECINAGIPFIAARTGGIPELIHEDDHQNALVEPTGPSIADRIVEIITAGQLPIRPAIDQSKNIPRWTALLQSVKAESPAKIHSAGENPLVSICLVHYERPSLLQKTLEGICAQTYTNFEVVLIDNDSRSSEALKFLAEIEDKYPNLRIRIDRLPDLYAGAARNRALSLSNGEYIVFMDDDNYAHPKQLETFVNAITRSSFDALSCALVVFDANDDPADLKRFIHLYIPAGSGISLNLFSNSYGDANGIYRKSALTSVGGLTEERLSWEDYELFSKLEQNGFKVGVIPEPLVYLRASVGSVSRRGSMLSNYYRALRPALKNFPWATYGDALLIALSPKLQATNSIRFEKDDVPDDQRIFLNSESPVVVARLLIERASMTNGLLGGIHQLSRITSTSGTLSQFRRDLLFSRVHQGIISPDYIGTMKGFDTEIADELVKLLKGRSFTDVFKFVSGHSLPAPQADMIYMEGVEDILSGDPISGLRKWASMLDDAELLYLKNNGDIAKGVSLKHLRSGVSHYLNFGYDEYRQFSYHHPLRGPLASNCKFRPDEYGKRIHLIQSLNAMEAIPHVETLLCDVISGGSVVAACDFARLLLENSENRYLSDHPDVALAIEQGGFSDAYAHWRIFGIQEPDRFHLIYSIRGSEIEQALFDRLLGPRIVHESAALDFVTSEVRQWISRIGVSPS